MATSRIKLANAAAAAFYHKNLFSLREAGVARAYVKSRGLSSTTVHAYCLGYAADVYFGNGWSAGDILGNGNECKKDRSLVAHLTRLGFEPREIVDAGLASVVKASWRATRETRSGGKDESARTCQASERRHFRSPLEADESTLGKFAWTPADFGLKYWLNFAFRHISSRCTIFQVWCQKKVIID